MARLIAFAEGYQESAHAIGAWGGSKASRAIGRAVRELAEADTLPDPNDSRGFVPRPRDATVEIWAHAHSVRGTRLVLWYQADDEVLTLFALTRR